MFSKTLSLQVFTMLMLAVLSYSLPNVAYAEHEHNHHGGGRGGGEVDINVGPYYYGPYPYYPTGYVVEPYYPVYHRHHIAASITLSAQQRLASLGYYQGSVDGIYGAQTRNAIMAFQHDKGLAITGTLNDATIAALGI